MALGSATTIQSARFVSLCPSYFNDEYWELDWGSPPFIWTGEYWHYNGNYAGCDNCGPTLRPIGTWAAGFRPIAVEFTIRVICKTIIYESFGSSFNPRFTITENTYSYPVSEELPGLEKPGTYQFRFNISPDIGDIINLNIYAGYGSSCNNEVDRPFDLLSLNFCT